MLTPTTTSNADGLMLSPEAYDKAILHPRLRELLQGDFYNVGLWSTAGDTPDTASARLVQTLVDLDQDKTKALNVLDVGCGLGAGSDVIATAYPGAKVIGLNYSERQISKAEATYTRQNLQFTCADAVALPFPDNSVDRIYCVEAAMHFRTRAAFLTEAHRVLHQGGRLLLADILCSESNSVIPIENIVPDTNAYSALCKRHGFSVRKIEDVTTQSVTAFTEYLRGVGQAPIARFFEQMSDAYVLVDLTRNAPATAA